MPHLLKLAIGLLVCCVFSSAFANALDNVLETPASHWRKEGDDAFRRQDYQRAYLAWHIGANVKGDSEQQEIIADLLLGAHSQAVKSEPYEGMRYLYRAAINGRDTAMLKLSKALSTGALGVRKSPEAATCWSKAPADFEQRLKCVAVTDFRDPRARPSCPELVFPPSEKRVNGQNGTTEQDGTTSAKLCLANKSPALFQPGIPPRGEELEHEYERRGIAWLFTGDVYDGGFENFRKGFNVTIAEAIEAERGRGYLERIYKEIRAKLAKQPQ
jgi:hypothetical protein